MKWISIIDNKPTEDGDYLVTVDVFGMHRYMKIVSWANDLSEIDKWDFPVEDYKNVGGFYDYNSEFGYYEIDNVLAWCEAEPYEGD